MPDLDEQELDQTLQRLEDDQQAIDPADLGLHNYALFRLLAENNYPRCIESAIDDTSDIASAFNRLQELDLQHKEDIKRGGKSNVLRKDLVEARNLLRKAVYKAQKSTKQASACIRLLAEAGFPDFNNRLGTVEAQLNALSTLVTPLVPTSEKP